MIFETKGKISLQSFSMPNTHPSNTVPNISPLSGYCCERVFRKKRKEAKGKEMKVDFEEEN
jgi:hypothetical protein